MRTFNSILLERIRSFWDSSFLWVWY